MWKIEKKMKRKWKRNKKFKFVTQRAWRHPPNLRQSRPSQSDWGSLRVAQGSPKTPGSPREPQRPSGFLGFGGCLQAPWAISVFPDARNPISLLFSMSLCCYELKFLIWFSFSFLFYFPHKEAARYDSIWALKLILSFLLCFTYCFTFAFHIRFNVSS